MVAEMLPISTAKKSPNLETTCGSSNKFNNSNFTSRTNVAPLKNGAKCFFSHSIQQLKALNGVAADCNCHIFVAVSPNLFALCYRPPLQYPNPHGLTQRAKPATYTATKTLRSNHHHFVCASMHGGSY